MCVCVFSWNYTNVAFSQWNWDLGKTNDLIFSIEKLIAPACSFEIKVLTNAESDFS